MDGKSESTTTHVVALQDWEKQIQNHVKVKGQKKQGIIEKEGIIQRQQTAKGKPLEVPHQFSMRICAA